MRKSFTNSIGACCSMLLILLLANNLNAQYCSFEGDSFAEDYIANVTFAGINNSSGATGYSDFTSISGIVSPGLDYPVSAILGNAGIWPETLTIYIDWDQSETFEPSERYDIGECTGSGCATPITGTISVPTFALPGETRMRVIGKYFSPPLGPCTSNGIMDFGEVEDYSLMVLGGECTPPDFTFTIINDCVADNYDVSATLTDFGTNTFITIVFTRSDGVLVSPATLVLTLEGQTITILNNIPFGVTVSASIQGQNPLCNLTRNFEELICPVENDEACTAIELTCGDVFTNQTFFGATQSIDDACFGIGVVDVWYKFTADGTQTYNIAQSGSDVVVDLWEGDECEAITQISNCSDFPENFLVTEAGNYYFRIRPWSTASTYGVSLTCTPFDCPGFGNYGNPCDDEDAGTVNDVINTDCECAGEPIADNDEACTATLLECGDSFSNVSFSGSTQSVDDACSGSGTRDVWFKFVHDGTQTYNIAETQTDVVVDLWEGDECGAITQITACSDFPENFIVTEAGTYYFRIRPWGAATTYGVSLTCTPFQCPDLLLNIGSACDDQDPGTVNDVVNSDCECAGVIPPANDECHEALPLTCGNTYTGTTLGAIYHSGLPTEFCGTALPNADNGGVWYTLTLENDTEVDLSLAGSNYDTKLFIFGQSCGSLTCVAGNDDFTGLTSRIVTTLEGGNTYYVFVSGYASNRGDFTLQVSCIDLVCSPTIESVSLVDSEGNDLECATIGQAYYLEVTLAGGTETSYNVTAGSSPITVINANGTGIVGPIFSGSVTVSVVGTSNPTCGASQAFTPTICLPANDQPCDAIAAMTDGSIINGTNIGATADVGEVAPAQGSCISDSTWCDNFAGSLGSVDNSVWYTFVGPASGRVRINGCNEGSTFDSQFAVYTASDCNDYSTFDLVGANDDANFALFGTCSFGSFRAGLELCIEPGVTYYLQVDGYAGSEGTFAITIEGVDAAACNCEAPVVPPGFIFASTHPYCVDGTVGYTLSFFSPEDIGSSEFFVYSYSYIPGDTTTVNVPAGGTVSSTDIVPLGTLTYIEIHLSDENCASAITGFPISGLVAQDEFACDPDCEGVPGGPAQAGTPCEVDGISGTYNTSCECVPDPSNLPCTATALECGSSVSGTTYNATPSGIPSPSCATGSLNDVFYTLDVVPGAEYTVSVNGSDYDGVLVVYSGDCAGPYTQLGCSDSGFIENIAETVVFTVATAQTVLIRTYDWSTTNGSFTITVSCVNENAANLNGTVNWNSNCDDRAGTVTLYTPNTATVVETYNISVASDGTFSISNLPTGSYDILVIVQGHLAKGFEDVEIAVGENNFAVGTIRNGNVNNDNAVNIFDLSVINMSFNKAEGQSNFNPLADLNCDGAVNVFDISILNASFNKVGDAAPL